MLLKLKLDTGQVNVKGQRGGIVIDTQLTGEENNFVADGPESVIEQQLAIHNLNAAKEAEVHVEAKRVARAKAGSLLEGH